MAGLTGYTAPTNGDAPEGPEQMENIYEHFDPLVGETVTTASSLPASGNWVGRRIYVQDDQSTRVWTGAAWYDTNRVPTNRQTDTTNAVVNTITQFGSGKIVGNNGAFISEAVTFPVAFAATPTVIVTPQGSRATGAFNETGLVGGAVAGATSAKSSSGFTAIIIAPGAVMASTNDWYYNWVAIGVLA